MIARAAWLMAGLLSVGVGAIGIVVPGLPTTVFFIIAASCFSRSSPRLEAWVLGLPKIGPMVADYRAGRGMPFRAKVWAISVMVIAVSVSTVLVLETVPQRVGVVALGIMGTWYVGYHIPTNRTPQPVAS
ncbi:MAG: DUF454 domain-containing protein [Actinomycetia bacterium]|nr:DUF454 domain-containing protein [Actinomycetes bacterium]